MMIYLRNIKPNTWSSTTYTHFLSLGYEDCRDAHLPLVHLRAVNRRNSNSLPGCNNSEFTVIAQK